MDMDPSHPGSLDALMAASRDGPFATDLRWLSPTGQRLDILQIHIADQFAPAPRRDRATAQATQIQAIIDWHEQTRPAHGSGNPEPQEHHDEPPTT